MYVYNTWIAYSMSFLVQVPMPTTNKGHFKVVILLKLGTLEIYTLFLTAIILNFSSFHDSSLTAAWAGHRLLGRLKQL